jgi:hypothetical protein
MRRRARQDPNASMRRVLGEWRDLVVINDETHHIYGQYALDQTPCVRSLGLGLLLLIITLRGLVDDVGVNCIDVGFAEDIVETFHAERGKGVFEYDIIELSICFGWYLPKIRGAMSA